MPLQFKSSPGPTLGVEMELQLVDRGTRNLVPAAPEILGAFPGEPWVKKELLRSTIEINTEICRDVREVEADLAEKIGRVRDVAAGLGVALVGAGTHPFARWEDQEVSDDDRYRRLVARVQWPAQRLLIFGLHVHVGVPNGEMAISLSNHLEQWLPHLLALSASSPFWKARDTGLASTRIKIFETLPTAGLPYRHASWREFEVLIEALKRSQAIETIREIWWDVRPHHNFGTIEVRVCDALPTLAETVAVAALVQALIVHLERRIGAGVELPILHPRIVRENKWRAARFSTRGSTLADEDGRLEPISETIEKLLDELEPVFGELGSAHELPVIRRMVREGPSCARQRAVFRETHELTEVVDSLVREFEENEPVRVGTEAR